MEICQELPPNFADILRVFLQAKSKNVVFAYGETLFNPGGGDVGPELLKHEETHGARQVAHDGGPAGWWTRYLTDKDFLLAEEVEAHRAEYAAYCGAHESGRERFLSFLISRLSGPLYRWPVPRERARRLITEGCA